MSVSSLVVSKFWFLLIIFGGPAPPPGRAGARFGSICSSGCRQGLLQGLVYYMVYMAVWSLPTCDDPRDTLRDKDGNHSSVRRCAGPGSLRTAALHCTYSLHPTVLVSSRVELYGALLTLFYGTERLVLTLLRTAPWRLTCLERTREVPFSAPSHPVCRPR